MLAIEGTCAHQSGSGTGDSPAVVCVRIVGLCACFLCSLCAHAHDCACMCAWLCVCRVHISHVRMNVCMHNCAYDWHACV